MSMERAAGVLERSAARHAGLVVGVRVGGETGFWSRGRLPDGVRSIFEIGSITKTFTATVLADMAREGLVDLADPVGRHLPPDTAPPVQGREITLEDLATHRSGLPRLPAGLLLGAMTSERRDPYARFDDARLRAAVRATRPKRAPGGKPVYSNYGMGLLGFALAHRAGKSYEALVRERVAAPLGLADTWIEPPAAARDRIADGHTWLGRSTPPWHLGALAGAGGLCSTAADLLSYLALHGPGAESPLAPAARETRARRARLGKVGLGLAWMILPADSGPPWWRPSREVVMHEGGTGGFRAFAAVVPATGTAVVVLANQAKGAGALGLRIVRAMLD